MRLLMMICFLLTSLLGISLAAHATSAVFQVSTISALTQGVYDGDYRYGDLMKKGDFGLGTFLDLNGEMVALDGHFYQIEASGKLTQVRKDQIVPFAEITYFHPSTSKPLNNVPNYNQLAEQLITISKNVPYAIRIDGSFHTLTLRSLRKQKKPYPTLVKAASEQAIYRLRDVKGTLVGFWFPAYWGGIAVPGFHLHFVTADRRTGGHVLELSIDQAKLSVAKLDQVHVYLPHTASFSQINLSDEQLTSSIKKAEGGT